MSNLELLNAGFAAIFGENGLPSSDIHELFEATYIMEPFPSLGASGGWSSLRSHMIDVFVYGLQGEIFTVKVLETYTVSELKATIEEETGIYANVMGLIYCGKRLDDRDETPLSSLGICHGSSVFLVLGLRGGGLPHHSVDPDGLDPQYDFDFSNVKDDGEIYMRGGHQYHRPYGWNRIAVKVISKFGYNEWLGQNGIRTEGAPNEWAVSYHGTAIENADKIIKEGFKPGPRQLYGKGVYSSPSIEMVENHYAQPFDLKGKRYLIAFQNRVNPHRVKIIPAKETGAGADYWLTQKDDTRPYGVLFKEIVKGECNIS